MKRGWKRFWLCGSALALWVPASTALLQSGLPRRANEVTLAGLRPGRDTLATARSLYGEKRRTVPPVEGKVWTWEDACRRRALRVGADERGVIQTLTLSEGAGDGNCTDPAADPARSRHWKAGRGLTLGDLRQRVLQLYGAPNSTSPSVRGQQELELLFYAFDWAGSDVPQVMEVTCDRASGRVVEITLAFPSL